MIREPFPDYYTSPPDWNGCKNLVKDGATPCWHPHCDCFPKTTVGWNRPDGCHCETLRQRACCYENCDEAVPPPSSTRASMTAEGLLRAAIVIPVLVFLYLLFSSPAPAAEADPYACFGAGRYDAMSSGRECPPKTEPKPHWSWNGYDCEMLKGYLQSHTEAEARAEAERLHFPAWVIRRAEKCLK